MMASAHLRDPRMNLMGGLDYLAGDYHSEDSMMSDSDDSSSDDSDDLDDETPTIVLPDSTTQAFIDDLLSRIPPYYFENIAPRAVLGAAKDDIAIRTAIHHSLLDISDEVLENVSRPAWDDLGITTITIDGKENFVCRMKVLHQFHCEGAANRSYTQRHHMVDAAKARRVAIARSRGIQYETGMPVKYRTTGHCLWRRVGTAFNGEKWVDLRKLLEPGTRSLDGEVTAEESYEAANGGFITGIDTTTTNLTPTFIIPEITMTDPEGETYLLEEVHGPGRNCRVQSSWKTITKAMEEKCPGRRTRDGKIGIAYDKWTRRRCECHVARAKGNRERRKRLKAERKAEEAKERVEGELRRLAEVYAMEERRVLGSES